MAATKTAGKAAGFTAEEKAAARARVQELKAEAAKADGLAELQAAIAKMPEPDRTVAKQVHALVMEAVPSLAPKTWYGMPAYAKDGNTICYFKHAGKFKSRYHTFGFSDKANLDDGNMWPAEYALTKVTPAEEKRIRALVKQAVL